MQDRKFISVDLAKKFFQVCIIGSAKDIRAITQASSGAELGNSYLVEMLKNIRNGNGVAA